MFSQLTVRHLLLTVTLLILPVVVHSNITYGTVFYGIETASKDPSRDYLPDIYKGGETDPAIKGRPSNTPHPVFGSTYTDQKISGTTKTGSVGSVTEPVKPVTEPVKPITEPVKPVTEPVKPVTEPVKNTKNPVKNTTVPVKNITDPVKNTTDPVKNITDPVKNTTEPIKNTTEPVKNTTEPVKKVTDPANNFTVPPNRISEPAVNKNRTSPWVVVNSTVDPNTDGVNTAITEPILNDNTRSSNISHPVSVSPMVNATNPFTFPGTTKNYTEPVKFLVNSSQPIGEASGNSSQSKQPATLPPVRNTSSPSIEYPTSVHEEVTRAPEVTPQALKLITKSPSFQTPRNTSSSLLETKVSSPQHHYSQNVSQADDFVDGLLTTSPNTRSTVSKPPKLLTPVNPTSSSTPLLLPPTDPSHDLNNNSDVTVIIANISTNITYDENFNPKIPLYSSSARNISSFLIEFMTTKFIPVFQTTDSPSLSETRKVTRNGIKVTPTATVSMTTGHGYNRSTVISMIFMATECVLSLVWCITAVITHVKKIRYMRKNEKQRVILVGMLLYLVTCILNIVSCLTYILLTTTTTSSNSGTTIRAILYVIFFTNVARIKIVEVLLTDLVVRLRKGFRLSWSEVLILTDGIIAVFLILLTPIVSQCELTVSGRWYQPECTTANVIIIVALFGILGLVGVVKLLRYTILRCTKELAKSKRAPMAHYSSIKKNHRKHSRNGHVECGDINIANGTSIKNEHIKKNSMCTQWLFCLYALGFVISCYLVFWLQ